MSIKGFNIGGQVQKYDYESLDNIPESQGVSDDLKEALLQIASKVAYIDDDGATYYQDLYDALYPPKDLLYITAVYTQSGTVYDDASLDSLKSDLVVTAKWEDNTETYVTTYTLSGTLTAGTSTVTVTYNGKTTTFTVTVTARPVLSSISAVYTQSGTVYITDTLDSLKADLVVTAVYSDSSTQTVPTADYTLSGTLTAGTSTITVSYGGKTDTFTVNVTRYKAYDYIYNADSTTGDTDAYVDTGLTYSPSFNTLNLEFEAMNSNTGSAACPLLGANNTTTSDTSNILWYARVSKGGFSAYNLGQAKQLNTVPGDTRAVCKYFFVDGGQSYMQWDSTIVNVATVSKSSIPTNTNTLILAGGYTFSSGNKYGMYRNGFAKLGYVKFTDPTTNTLLYHFVPAQDLTTEKYGFYEQVNGVFYEANGTKLRCANWEA